MSLLTCKQMNTMAHEPTEDSRDTKEGGVISIREGIYYKAFIYKTFLKKVKLA